MVQKENTMFDKTLLRYVWSFLLVLLLPSGILFLICNQYFFSRYQNEVLEHYGDKNAQWLSQLTHLESPWKEARVGIPNGVSCDNIITKESMAMYYGSID